MAMHTTSPHSPSRALTWVLAAACQPAAASPAQHPASHKCPMLLLLLCPGPCRPAQAILRELAGRPSCPARQDFEARLPRLMLAAAGEALSPGAAPAGALLGLQQEAAELLRGRKELERLEAKQLLAGRWVQNGGCRTFLILCACYLAGALVLANAWAHAKCRARLGVGMRWALHQCSPSLRRLLPCSA